MATNSSEPNIDIFQLIDSTSLYLRKQVTLRDFAKGDIVLAEEQSKGIGRNNRAWVSPGYKNIYMSLYWEFAKSLSDFSCLSLVVAIAEVNAIKKFLECKVKQDLEYIIKNKIKGGASTVKFLLSSDNFSNSTLKEIHLVVSEKVSEIKIKWPNDILYRENKLSGILIDTIKGKQNIIQAVIGCGVNVNYNGKLPDSDRVVGSMLCVYKDIFNALILKYNDSLFGEIIKKHLLEYELNRNEYLGFMINEFYLTLSQFENNGFSPFVELWHELDFLYNKNIEIVLPNNDNVLGVAKGIDNFGGIIIQSEDKMHKIYSAQQCLVRS